jgi:hypothetical protein
LIGVCRENSWPERRIAAWNRVGNVNLRQRTDNGDVKLPRNWFFPSGTGAFAPRQRYNPFTAADEKIALSVVHVNNKPQHIVFCCHSQYPHPKHWEFACGKRQTPCGAHFRGVQDPLSLDAIRAPDASGFTC